MTFKGQVDVDGLVSGQTGLEEQYKIGIHDMDKRLRVFIHQLLPDMLQSIDSREAGWFMIQALYRRCAIFFPKLNEEQEKEGDKAVCEWIEKWEVKMKEKNLPKILPKKSPTPDVSNLMGGFQYYSDRHMTGELHQQMKKEERMLALMARTKHTSEVYVVAYVNDRKQLNDMKDLALEKGYGEAFILWVQNF